ncbi:MAG: hypothetical protein HYX47_14225 [Burkholderiales bacterium]|nr:hypothetical protein [Burkholderiales bacterium]
MAKESDMPATGDRTLPRLQAAALLLIIGPQWLVTRDLFDGATVSFAWAIHNPDGLFFWFMNSNWLVAVWLFKACFGLADLLGTGYLWTIKLLITALLAGLYAEFVALGRGLFGFPQREARLAGLLCLASPSLYILVNSAAVPVVFCIWLVFLGHRLFRSEDLRVRVAGLAVLAVSFQLNSNLVFALALEVVFICRFPLLWRARLRWFAALFAVAVAVYATMRMLSPPRQIFAEYNRLLNPLNGDDLRRMVRATLMFASWGVIPLAALAGAGLWGLRRRGSAAGGAQGGFDWVGLACVAFLCAAAAFPYVMVGKGPPLFTPVGYGSGLTEQVLRASHSGPFAPTWANTSARHGFLFAIPLALLAWMLARGLLGKLRAWTAGAAVPLFLGLAPLFLFWVLPAYYNKLEMQAAEISLARGLKTLPAAPAGVVDLRYAPVSDWLIWSNSAGMVLREAWGRSDYYAMFHALDVYRDDLQWQYHAYIRATGGLDSALIQHSMAMDRFPGERCISTYQAALPQMTMLSVLMWAADPGAIPPAQVSPQGSQCEDGRVMPNPMPDKKLIP